MNTHQLEKFAREYIDSRSKHLNGRIPSILKKYLFYPEIITETTQLIEGIALFDE